ncbi:hypothetical protein ACYOEI_18015 [Singulisphaera rosea]
MDNHVPDREPGRWLRVELWGVLGLLALLHFSYNILIVADLDDTENLETTLANVIAGQFARGFDSLYGPYSRANPRVLIQAPLYYRLAGLSAWPLIGLGFHPVRASFLAGRAISLLSTLALLALVARMARLEDRPKRAGIWAMFLVMSSNVLANYPVMTRPDMLGVALQTLGAYLVLRTLCGPSDSGRWLIPAFLSFALACCVKQHNVSAWATSLVVLSGAWMRRPELRRSIERAILAGFSLVALYYLGEELFTTGRMSRSVFLMPSLIRRSNPIGWVGIPGYFFIVGACSTIILGLWIGALLSDRRAFRGSRADRLAWAYLATDVLIQMVLVYNNPGSWANYAIQSVVFASVLLGRALSRIVAVPQGGRWRIVPLGIAAVAILVADFDSLHRSVESKLGNVASLNALFREPRFRPGSVEEVYFAGQPQYNRLAGRAELAHDEWLYGQFENARMAEPRTRWLRSEFAKGSIRYVIVPVDPPFAMELDPPVIPGLSESLPELGYDLIFNVGRFKVWEKHRPPSPTSSSPKPRSPALP